MGIFDYFSRRRGRGQDPAHGAQTADQRATAAMLGNQAMLELAARRQRAGAAADGGMDEGELERRMLARLPDGGQEDRAQAAQDEVEAAAVVGAGLPVAGAQDHVRIVGRAAAEAKTQAFLDNLPDILDVIGSLSNR